MDGDDEEYDAMWSARCSVSSSAGSLRDDGDQWDEQSLAAGEEKVFVAVDEDFEHGKSTFLWALQNLATDGSKIVVAHVHSPAQALSKSKHLASSALTATITWCNSVYISRWGAKVHCTSMKPEEISEYLMLAREEAEKNLDEYAPSWHHQACHGSSRRPTLLRVWTTPAEPSVFPNSKTALKLMKTASPSCKIWFTCNGHREPNENLLAVYVPHCSRWVHVRSQCHQRVARRRQRQVADDEPEARKPRAHAEQSTPLGYPRVATVQEMTSTYSSMRTQLIQMLHLTVSPVRVDGVGAATAVAAPRRAGGVDVTATDARSGLGSARAAAKTSGGRGGNVGPLTGCAPAASPRRAMLPHAALAYGRRALPL